MIRQPERKAAEGGREAVKAALQVAGRKYIEKLQAGINRSVQTNQTKTQSRITGSR